MRVSTCCSGKDEVEIEKWRNGLHTGTGYGLGLVTDLHFEVESSGHMVPLRNILCTNCKISSHLHMAIWSSESMPNFGIDA